MLILRQVPVSSLEPIEARLGDLDLKSVDGGKGQYWLTLERNLINGGWYISTEKHTTQRNKCLLARQVEN